MIVGINGPPDARFTAAEVLVTGARLIRFPAWPDVDTDLVAARLADYAVAGIGTLLVLDRSAIGDDPALWEARIREWRAKYGLWASGWEAGNEPDHASDSSSTMSPQDFGRLLKIARRALGPQARIIAGGQVSGNPDWLNEVDLSPVDALGVHPYGKHPEFDWPFTGWGTGYLLDLLNGYRRFGKPLAITEIGLAVGDGISEPFQAEYLARTFRALDRWGVAQACWFALHDDVKGFGLLRADGSKRPAYDAFRAAAGGPIQPPAPVPPTHAYQLGIAEKVAQLRAAGFDPGPALEPETYPFPDAPYSFQMGERGLFVYSRQAKRVQFYETR